MTYVGSASHGSGYVYGGPSNPAPSWAMANRVLMFVRDDPTFDHIASGIGETGRGFSRICALVGVAFTLEGRGAILDRLGAILQRPRPAGTNDDGYTILLRVQVEQILASQSGIETVLAIVLAVTGNTSPGYYEFDRAEFLVACESPDAATTALLLALLHEASAGGVRFQLVEYLEGRSPVRGNLVDLSLTDTGVGSLVGTDFATSYTGVKVHE